MPRHATLLLVSCLLIDLAVIALLVVLAIGHTALPDQSAASWLDGRGGAALAPIVILKFALAGLLFLDGGGRQRLSARLTATAWLWLATGKVLGLHLVIGPILTVHLLVLLPAGGLVPPVAGKLLAMAAVAGLAAAFLLGARHCASDRAAVTASHVGLTAVAMLGLATVLPELARLGSLADARLPLAAVELAVELGVASLLLVGAAASGQARPRGLEAARRRPARGA